LGFAKHWDFLFLASGATVQYHCNISAEQQLLGQGPIMKRFEASTVLGKTYVASIFIVKDRRDVFL
jgi:hypothetical protein